MNSIARSRADWILLLCDGLSDVPPDSALGFAERLAYAVLRSDMETFYRLYGRALDAVEWSPEHCEALLQQIESLLQGDWIETLVKTSGRHRCMCTALANLACGLADRAGTVGNQRFPRLRILT